MAFSLEVKMEILKLLTICQRGSPSIQTHTQTHTHSPPPTGPNWGGGSGRKTKSALQKDRSSCSPWRPHLHASLLASHRGSEDLIYCKEPLEKTHAIGKVRFHWTKSSTPLMNTRKKWLSGPKKQILNMSENWYLSTFYFMYLCIFFIPSFKKYYWTSSVGWTLWYSEVWKHKQNRQGLWKPRFSVGRENWTPNWWKKLSTHILK